MSLPIADEISSSSRKRQNWKILALVLLCAAATAGWAIAVASRNRAAKPELEHPVDFAPHENVEIWVAARDLPVGTVIRKEFLHEIAIRKSMAKQSLPPAYVTDAEALIGWVHRPILKSEVIPPDAVSKINGLSWPNSTLDVITLRIPAREAQSLTPGTKVDVKATWRRQRKTVTTTLLVDKVVFAVGSELPAPDGFVTVSFQATQMQALVVSLATHRGSNLELCVRLPGDPRPEKYNINEVLREISEVESSDWTRPLYLGPIEPPPEVAPSPRITGDSSRRHSSDQTVEVWVASRDLPVGTLLKRQDLDTYAVKKRVARDELPSGFVVNAEDLFDRRLGGALPKGQPFHSGVLTKGSLVLRDGQDLITLPLGKAQDADGFIKPGCKVDVLATLQVGDKPQAMPILVEMLVLAVDIQADPAKPGEDQIFVSFAATQKQALVLALAKQRGAKIDLLLRDPEQPIDRNYNIDKVLELLQEKK